MRRGVYTVVIDWDETTTSPSIQWHLVLEDDEKPVHGKRGPFRPAVVIQHSPGIQVIPPLMHTDIGIYMMEYLRSRGSYRLPRPLPSFLL